MEPTSTRQLESQYVENLIGQYMESQYAKCGKLVHGKPFKGQYKESQYTKGGKLVRGKPEASTWKTSTRNVETQYMESLRRVHGTKDYTTAGKLVRGKPFRLVHGKRVREMWKASTWKTFQRLVQGKLVHEMWKISTWKA